MSVRHMLRNGNETPASTAYTSCAVMNGMESSISSRLTLEDEEHDGKLAIDVA